MLLFQLDQIIPRLAHDNRHRKRMPHILLQLREVVDAHRLHLPRRRSGVIGHKSDNHLRDHNAIQRRQLSLEDRLLAHGVDVVEEMDAVLLTEVVEGIGDAADDRGHRFSRGGGGDGNDGDVVDVVQAGVHDAPFIVRQEVAANGFRRRKLASDSVTDAGTKIEEGLEGAASFVDEASASLERNGAPEQGKRGGGRR